MKNNCAIVKAFNIMKKAVFTDSQNTNDEDIRDAMLQGNKNLDITMHMIFQMTQLNLFKR